MLKLIQTLRPVFSIATLVFSSALTWAVAETRLPAIFSSDMVLQQGIPIPVWGWDSPGQSIQVRLGDDVLTTRADTAGAWSVVLPPRRSGGPLSLSVNGQREIVLSNVMIGEVWICSGQSNMQWTVGNSDRASEEIAGANWPWIRLFTVAREVADEPRLDCSGQWTECKPETVSDFSAVAYFFGRHLQQELRVPVGLIHTSWGGTPAEAWTTHETLQEDQDFEPILNRYEEAVRQYPVKKAEYERALAESKNRDERPPRPPFGPGHPHSPAGLFNAMIHPLAPFAIRGAIWYQGEANAGRAHQYSKLLSRMIGDWRALWAQGDFPFAIVQLANYMKRDEQPQDSAWAELREAQDQVSRRLPNVGLATAIDIGEADDIHPRNKQEVGRRLALWALATSYQKPAIYSGPRFRLMEIRGGQAKIQFDHVGRGLQQRGDQLLGFAIAGQDRRFVWAEAKLEGDSVLVWSPAVPNPVAVRYAWGDNPASTLYNREGLPALPFRTDQWPGETLNER